MSEFNFFNESSFQINISSPKFLEVCQSICSDYEKNCGWINVICMDDKPHTDLNINYLSHDYSTDVLTFDFIEEDEINGEIYINVLIAEQNATDNSVSLENEIQRLIIHGTLHLIGIDDATEELRNEMHELENLYLTRFM